MNRKETTKFLSDLLVYRKFSDRKYYASEVSLDMHTSNITRVDFMQFEPCGVIDIADIEKGIFTCYEVKSCKADFNSGFGRNFIGEKNYFVMPMSVYKEVVREIPSGIGCLVPVPKGKDKLDEFENPTELTNKVEDWELKAVLNSLRGRRKKSMVELLFCMLRSGR